MPIQAQSADGIMHEFPDGTDQEVIGKVMKEYATQNAPAAAQAEKTKAPGWLEAIESAGPAAVDEVKSAVKGTGRFFASLPDDPLGYKIGRAIKAVPGAVATSVGGAMQYFRNLSPPEFRGSAPEMAGGEPENHPWLALGAGDTSPMRQAIATKPLKIAGNALNAALMTPTGAGLLGKGLDMVADSRIAAKTGNALNRIANIKPGANEARAAGYVLPPAAALEKPGVVNNLASGFGGKVKLQQGASVRNQEVTNRLATEDLGLPANTPLTPPTFKAVRANATKAYKAVANSVPEIETDQVFHDAIADLGGRNSAAGEQFPGVMKNEALDDFIKNIGSVKKFTPDAGLEVVRKLRKDARTNLNSFDDPNKGALGMAQRNAANEIDELIERNLEAQGQAGKVPAYRAARQLLAKSHDIEGATNIATGDVSAVALGRLAAKGRPLTGGVKTIADAANAFPKAMQNPEKFGGYEPYSALDALAAITASVVTHNPAPLAAVFARPAVRSGLLSEANQNRMIPDLTQLPTINMPPPPAGGNALLHNTPLPGVQNQLAKGIFRAAHVNGLRAMTVPQAAQTIPNGE